MNSVVRLCIGSIDYIYMIFIAGSILYAYILTYFVVIVQSRTDTCIFNTYRLKIPKRELFAI